jgi:hypothetical protein
MIFLLPVALLIGVMVLSGRRGDAAPAVSGAEATWNGATTSPLAVMCECLRAGKLPPPFVLQCAIAQARSIGRPDLAQQIEQKFFASPAQRPTPAAWFARALPVTQAQPIAPQVTASPSPVATPIAQPQAATIPSPIPGVASGAYAEFARRLEREAPTFQSQRHVGRYRQNKARLAEIGFDPEILVGAPDAQDAALFADVGDAYQHVVASGMADTLVGRAIVLPDTGADDEAPMVTLSGVLGVANVAGLDGAVEWFERKEDRKRYPHTTKAFQSTNGVF